MTLPIKPRRVVLGLGMVCLVASGLGCRSNAPCYGSPDGPRGPYLVRRPPASPPVPRRGVVINSYAGFNYNRRTPILDPPATLIAPDDTAAVSPASQRF